MLKEPISRRDFLKLTASTAGWFLLEDGKPPLKGEKRKVIEGNIPLEAQVDFGPRLKEQGLTLFTKILPEECVTYDGKLYQVRPNSIWWHWDGGPTPQEEDHDRVFTTYNGLTGRTREGDPVGTHFSVGPGEVLQMLPLGEKLIIQGRLTDDRGIQDVRRAESFGGIQIETTGAYYDETPPPASQTESLVKLTITLMRQYGLRFNKILGHLERSPRVGKPDPGLGYLRETRILLLKQLIGRGDFDLVGPPESWRFYRLAKGVNGEIVRVETQSLSEILNSLSPQEKETLSGDI